MTVDVILYAGEVTPERTAGRTAVVIDVLRATSVMTAALANGAKAVYPVASVEDAQRLAEGFPKDNIILAGERNALRIEGFDLGNSPLSFTRETVEGKTIIQTTTNGTLAISKLKETAGQPPAHIFTASFLNMDAAARAIAGTGKDAVLVCSGREGEFTMEDGLCAGAITGLLSEHYGYVTKDIATAMQRLYDRYQADLTEVLCDTEHYRYLTAKGFSDDIEFCLRRNVSDAVPRLDSDGAVRI